MDALETKWFYMFIIYLYNIYMLIIIYKKDTCRNVKQKWFRIFSFCPTPEIWKKHVECLLLDYGIYIYIYVIYIYTYIYTYIYIHTYISSIMITFKQFCIDLYILYLNVENFLPAFFMLFVDLLLKAALHHHLTAST